MEIIDRSLLRQLLDAHNKTAIEWIYIDTGKLNIKSILQLRRFMFLWHILQRDKTELIRRIFEAQKISYSNGDWIKLIEEDKKELDINMTDQEIQNISKEKFKQYVKENVKKLPFFCIRIV